jgi:hypothetical protein
MNRTATIFAVLAVRLFLADGTTGCGSKTLGGNGGDAPITGIGGMTGSGPGNGGAGNVGVVGTGGIGECSFGAGNCVATGRGGVLGTGGISGRGGAFGRGGVFGTAGEFGTGGFGGMPICTDPSPPVCGATLCGNGVPDTCIPTPAPGCPRFYYQEECDGTVPAAVGTCQSLGYFSGDLSCTAKCTVDYRGCQECAPLDSLLAACGPAPIALADGYAAAIAASDSEVVLALVDDNAERLTFARLSPALALTGSTVLDDPGPGTPTGNAIIQVGIAAIPSGWVVAVCRDHDVYVHAVDATGKSVARTSLMHNDTFDDACRSLSIAGRPGAGPLAIWQTDAGVFSAIVATDGRSIDASPSIANSSGYQGPPVRAAWLGGAFYAAMPVLGSGYQYTLDLISVHPDGTSELVRELLPGDLGWSPAVTAGANDLRLAYYGLPAGGIAPADLGVIWQRLGLAGELVSVPVEITTDVNANAMSAVAVGDDTFVLLGNYFQPGLSIVRLGLDGRIVTPLRDIARGSGISSGDMVRRGPDLIALWNSFNKISVARLTP